LLTKKSDLRNKVIIPVIAVVGVVAVVFLTNAPTRTENGVPVISSVKEYDAALVKVTQSTPPAVSKFNMGLELEQADKDVALEGAKIFDSMNAYRPHMSAGYLEAGLLYYLSGYSDLAVERLKQGLADAPVSAKLNATGDPKKMEGVLADCHHLLSLIAFDRHDYKSAVNEANMALLHVTTRESYYMARAQAEVQLNWIPEAKRDVALALKLNPNYLPAQRLDGFLKH
jgi:hypothetical protein